MFSSAAAIVFLLPNGKELNIYIYDTCEAAPREPILLKMKIANEFAESVREDDVGNSE